MTKTLVDGDIITYRCGFSCEDKSLKEAYDNVDELMDYILTECSFYNQTGDYEVYLTGKGVPNYRDRIAKSAVYKGNRNQPKPKHLTDLRDYLVEKYDAKVSMGEEADDLIGIEATKIGPFCVIASVDKDMLQIPAYHFNFNRNEWTVVDAVSGIRFFYKQILTGDAADNIKGLYRVGPKKADKILGDAATEDDLWECVVKAYDGDIERILENARLLWLRRYEGEIWEPPHQRKLKAG